MRDGAVRRARLRLARVAMDSEPAGRGPYDPPLFSVSPRHVRVIDADGTRRAIDVELAREELWFVSAAATLRAAFVDDKLWLALESRLEGRETLERTLVRIPGRHPPPSEGAARYFGRWEHAKDRAVLSAKGAGIIVDGKDSFTAEAEPVLLDVYRGQDMLLALKNVPNGARVVAAEGIEGLSQGALVSDIGLPELEKGPLVEVHPHDAFLRGHAALGFSASFGGLPFAGLARARGDGSPDLARFTKTVRGLAWGAVRAIETPSDEDATLDAALGRALESEVDAGVSGRRTLGKAGTIALSDGRRFRVKAAAREKLGRREASHELLTCAILHGPGGASLLVTVAAPMEGFDEPTPERVLEALSAFLVGFHARA